LAVTSNHINKPEQCISFGRAQFFSGNWFELSLSLSPWLIQKVSVGLHAAALKLNLSLVHAYLVMEDEERMGLSKRWLPALLPNKVNTGDPPRCSHIASLQ
jgi:hypothetical protein